MKKVDTRVISASNQQLSELVRTGRFRQDLYYRLNVIRIALPPLRQRQEDIPLLVNHFIQKFSDTAKRKVEGMDGAALAVLKAYDWPGNIRELEHAVEHAVLLGKNAVIGLADLPTHLVARGDGAVSVEHALSRQLTLHELEREYIDKTLEATRGNKTEDARILGVDRTTLYRKLVDKMRESDR